MKKVLSIVAATLLTSGAVAAADWDRAEVVTTFASGNLETSLTFGDADFDGITVRGYTGDWERGATLFWTAVETEYSRADDTVGLAAIIGAETSYSHNLSSWAELKAAYVAPTGQLSEGEGFLTADVGVNKTVGEKTAVFAGLNYTTNVSNDWTPVGGEVEVGGSLYVGDDLLVIGSAVKPFDVKGNDDAFLKFETVLNF